MPTVGLVMVHNGMVTPVARSSQPQCEGSRTASTPCISPMVCDQEILFDHESGEMQLPNESELTSTVSLAYSHLISY